MLSKEICRNCQYMGSERYMALGWVLWWECHLAKDSDNMVYKHSRVPENCPFELEYLLENQKC